MDLQPRDPLWDLLPEKPLHMLPLSIGSGYGTGMGYAFTYAIGLKTKDALVCKWIRNRLWIHRPWILYRLLRNRFFNDLWFNPGNADLNPVWQWILNPPIWTISGPSDSIRCSFRFSRNSPFLPKVRNVGMLKKLQWNQERDSNWKQEAANSKKYAYSSWSLTRQISYAEKVQQERILDPFLSTPEAWEEGEWRITKRLLEWLQYHLR